MPTGIYIRTQYHRDIVSKSIKGRKLSPEHIEKIRLRMIGNQWNKGRFGELNGHYGKKHSEELKNKWSIERKGRRHTIKSRIKMRENAKKGEESHLWKGGITDKNLTIRSSLEFRLWRKEVFRRDNWTCQKCKKRGGKLQAHHIKSFAQYPELRFDIDNGITLCKKCHKLTDNYGRPRKSFRHQLLLNRKGHSTLAERRFAEILKRLHIPFRYKVKIQGREVDFIIGKYAIEVDSYKQDVKKNYMLLKEGYIPIHLANYIINSNLEEWLKQIWDQEE